GKVAIRADQIEVVESQQHAEDREEDSDDELEAGDARHPVRCLFLCDRHVHEKSFRQRQAQDTELRGLRLRATGERRLIGGEWSASLSLAAARRPASPYFLARETRQNGIAAARCR